MKRILAWLEARLSLRDSVGPMLMHPIPRGAAGPMGWWYVFGSASMTLLLIQILTGIGLALVYVPTADQAYESLVYLNDQQPLGWFLRSLHYWSGSAMVVMVVVHMTQVFLHGAFKYPRELNWLTGVLLLLLTLGMAFTRPGPAMGCRRLLGRGRRRVDGRPRAGAGPVHGRSAAGRSGHRRRHPEPVLRSARLRHPRPAAGLPGVASLAGARNAGSAQPPVPGKTVDPRTYQEEYEKELQESGVPFFGEAMLKDALFSSLTVIVVVVLAAIAGPKGPGALPEPALLGANPKPDWPFWWLFALLSLSPPVGGDLDHPGIARGADRRLVPGAVRLQSRGTGAEPPAGGGAVGHRDLHGAGVLTYYGATEPWSPVMGAWSGDAVPEDLVKASTPLQLQGAVVLQNKQCRNCHALEGVGRPSRTGLERRRHPPDARSAHRSDLATARRAAATCRPTASRSSRPR